MEGSNAWWPMEEEEAPFHLFPLSLNKFYLNFHFFHWI
jgi:hypothetical protein